MQYTQRHEGRPDPRNDLYETIAHIRLALDNDCIPANHSETDTVLQSLQSAAAGLTGTTESVEYIDTLKVTASVYVAQKRHHYATNTLRRVAELTKKTYGEFSTESFTAELDLALGYDQVDDITLSDATLGSLEDNVTKYRDLSSNLRAELYHMLGGNAFRCGKQVLAADYNLKALNSIDNSEEGFHPNMLYTIRTSFAECLYTLGQHKENYHETTVSIETLKEETHKPILSLLGRNYTLRAMSALVLKEDGHIVERDIEGDFEAAADCFTRAEMCNEYHGLNYLEWGKYLLNESSGLEYSEPDELERVQELFLKATSLVVKDLPGSSINARVCLDGLTKVATELENVQILEKCKEFGRSLSIAEFNSTK